MSMVRFYLEGNIKEQNIQWRIQEGPQGARALRSLPSYLRAWMTPPPPPPLSESLDPPLIFPLL